MTSIWIWHRVGGLTNNWHDSGGVAVVAPTLAEARELLAGHKDVRAPVDEEPCGAFTEEPTVVYTLANDEAPRVMVFPDAGCC